MNDCFYFFKKFIKDPTKLNEEQELLLRPKETQLKLPVFTGEVGLPTPPHPTHSLMTLMESSIAGTSGS